MAFAIKRQTPPPLNGTNFYPFFTPLFSIAIEYYLHEMDFTPGPSQNYQFESSYNLSKIDNYWYIQPLWTVWAILD